MDSLEAMEAIYQDGRSLVSFLHGMGHDDCCVLDIDPRLQSMLMMLQMKSCLCVQYLAH